LKDAVVKATGRKRGASRNNITVLGLAWLAFSHMQNSLKDEGQRYFYYNMLDVSGKCD